MTAATVPNLPRFIPGRYWRDGATVAIRPARIERLRSPYVNPCVLIELDGLKPVTTERWLWRKRQNQRLESTRRRRVTKARDTERRNAPRTPITWEGF